METSVPGIFAAGDVAEHDGMVLGLWPIAAKQGEVAAVNALGGPGGPVSLTAEVPATILKGVGLDVFSIGQFAPGDNDTAIVAEERDPYDPSYRKLVISGGRAVGATVVGNDPEVVAAATAAVKNRAEVTPQVLADLRRGEWAALRDAGRATQPA